MMYIRGVLQSLYSTRNAVALGGLLMVSGTFFSSFATSLPVILLTQGVMFGLGVGLCYTPAITCSVDYFPDRKALITGIIVAGFGGGAFLFGMIAVSTVNLDGVSVQQAGINKGY